VRLLLDISAQADIIKAIHTERDKKEENTMVMEYKPQGVCSRKMIIDVEDGIVKSLEVIGGCHGNLQGISKLVAGMKVEDVIERLEGIRCGFKPTSCPDQLAQALKAL